MTAPLRVDFIADVTCPWCAIGLKNLEQAITRVADDIAVDLQLEPFELNPGMPIEGEPIADYAMRKSGADATQMAARQAMILEAGRRAGLTFLLRTHVYNTFDSHRLLAEARAQGRALELMRELLDAYHCRGENIAHHDVLLAAAERVGLDMDQARAVLRSEAHAQDVNAAVRRWQRAGISGVPAVVVDQRHGVPGCQDPSVYEQVLRAAAAERRA